MSFLHEYRSVRSVVADGTARSRFELLRDWLASRPDALFDDLRAHMPTFVLGRLAIITRMADVRDVLERQDVFSVGPYGDAIQRINRGANFLLGMDDGPEYRRDVARLSRVLGHDDMARVQAVVSARTNDALASALSAGHLDLTDDFGRLVPILVVGDVFGGGRVTC